MARHKDGQWNLPDTVTWDQVGVALLMDIRDELKQLNRTLGCYRVQRMSDDINRMERRLANGHPLTRKKRRS